jgi:hypothetical protein
MRFSLDHNNDADILEYLDGLPTHQRSVVIRDALRSYIHHDGVTLGDIWEDLQALKAMNINLQGRGISLKEKEKKDPSEISEDILSNLDQLGVN